MSQGRAANKPDIGDCQSSARMGFAVARAATLNRISCILSYCSMEKMLGIHAAAIVTRVADDEIRMDVPMRQSVSHAMREILPVTPQGKRGPAYTSVAIPVLGSMPLPALVKSADIDLAPKLVNEILTQGGRFRPSAERFGIARPVAEFLSGVVKPSFRNFFSARAAGFHVCIIAILLTGCASQPHVIDTSCAWTRPIMVSRGDTLTDDTARQILSHNTSWEKLCGQDTHAQL